MMAGLVIAYGRITIMQAHKTEPGVHAEILMGVTV